MAKKNRYDIVTWTTADGEKIPVHRWLLSTLEAATKLRKKDWNNIFQNPLIQQEAVAAQKTLAADLKTCDWSVVDYSLDAILDATTLGTVKLKGTVLDLLSDALWIEGDYVREVLEAQWALWDKGKVPSVPSPAFLKTYGLGKTSTGGMSTVGPSPGPAEPSPAPSPDIEKPFGPTVDPDNEEESGFPWWILVVAATGGYLYYKNKKR